MTLIDDIRRNRATLPSASHTYQGRMEAALLAAEELAEACESVFDGIDAVGTTEFYVALYAYRAAVEGKA